MRHIGVHVLSGLIVIAPPARKPHTNTVGNVAGRRKKEEEKEGRKGKEGRKKGGGKVR